ncbi:major facilitator superfamily transporter 10 isoform X1 [Osmia lignaria lignaria]|uniref:major facilitator superfamily transporter 10 isoform X1 n=2 Tax=Osmia lignaria TaxID=473952 RepID=UPI0014792D0B|nr:sialin isoform X1 [Osmia lignaria]
MEVLDPSVSRDDQPLCINDHLDKVTLPDIPSDTKSCIKARYTFGFLGFLGFALVYAMRVNLSVAIVSMVNQTAIPHDDDNDTTDVCRNEKPINGTFIPSAGEFNWDERTQGVILGAFFLGYVITNVPGGRMAEKFGGKLIFGLGVFLTAVLTVISPFAAYAGLVPFLAVRVAEGFTEGVTFPAMHSMLALWVPPLERSKFAAIVYAGANFGTVISLPVSGWFCSLELWGGWPLAFYLFGGLGIVWYAFWFIFVFDSPAQHTKIDPLERAFIEASVEKKDEDNDSGVPWLSVFTSLPMWAIAITQCGQSWAFYTLLTELPTYMDKILHFDVQQDAFLSALPYLSSWLVGLGISSFADALLARQLISPLASFKLWNTVASLGPSLSFIGAIWAECDRMTVMMMLAGLGSLQGAVYAGNQMNHIALAPRYAGTLYGLTNAASNACGFLAPYVIGRLVQGHETLARWHAVFWLAAAINMGTNCFYLIFASATEQPWSKGSS